MTEPAEAQQPKRRRQHLPGTPTMPSQPPSALASGSAAGHARPTATGCKNCIDCAQSLTWSKAALCRSSFKSAEWQEWWPAGLTSPTMYFYLRAKQLRHLLRSGHSGAAELWRPLDRCEYRACDLLHSRGAAPLAIHVPVAQTGIEQPEECQYLGSVVVLLRRAAPAATAATLPQLTAAALEAHSRSQARAGAAAAPTAAALAAAKLQAVAQLAVARAAPAPSTGPAHDRTGGGLLRGGLHRVDRCVQLSPASSSGSLSLASSGGFSFSGLSLQSSPSPTSPADRPGLLLALPPRPPKPRAPRELAPPGGLQRVDCANLHWQQQLLFIRQQAQREQQCGVACQPPVPWGPTAMAQAPWRAACPAAPLPS